MIAGCVSTSGTGGGGVADAGGDEVRTIEDLVLVDCLLPGQIRQLGSQMTYLAPRRRVKTTKSDCGIRGGEFVLFDRSDYGTALHTLLPKAQGGDAVAQTYVGEIYEKGLGLPGPDYAAAAVWYRKAAKRGHRPAQTNLGLLYERGLGVPKDKSEALNWYRQATGLNGDRLIFESKLKTERAAFRREIALRNRVAASLRRGLQQASASGVSGASPAVAVTSKKEMERVAESAIRETQSEKDQVQRQIHAVQEVKKQEGIDKGTSKNSTKKAQIKKLELSLREQLDSLDDNQQRLASAGAS
jgi:hypothetical protein